MITGTKVGEQKWKSSEHHNPSAADRVVLYQNVTEVNPEG